MVRLQRVPLQVTRHLEIRPAWKALYLIAIMEAAEIHLLASVK